MGLRYRPDIDVLRAISVMAVVFYHFGLGCKGGFVGVDIFFVISGFLITRLLINDIVENRFSFPSFWERRIRRLLPAFVANVAAVVAFSWLILLPPHLKNLGLCLSFQSFLSTNLVFWRRFLSGYFGDYAEYWPTLHHWSLAVEEQFYIIYPAVLLFVYSFLRDRQRFYVLFIMLIVSLFACIALTPKHSALAFFLLPTRAWELLMGCLLAIWDRDRSDYWTDNASNTPRKAAAFFGVLLLAGPMLVFDRWTSFPGVNALAPCLGACLVIFAHQTSGCLVYPPAILVGRASYSIYLWHWPILSFSKYLYNDLPIGFRSLLAAIAVLAGLMSYRFIELPFRNGSYLRGRRRSFYVMLIVTVLTLIGGVIFVVHDGCPNRYSAKANQLFDSKFDRSPFLETTNRQIQTKTYPLLGVRGGPDFVVWGDSHALALAPAFNDSAAKWGMTGFLITKRATPPTLNHDLFKPVMQLVEEKNVSHVIICCRLGYVNLYDDLSATIKAIRLAGGTPVVIRSVPDLPVDLPICLATRERYPFFPPFAFSIEDYNLQSGDLFQRLRHNDQAIVVDPTAVMFDKQGKLICELRGRATYWDTNHLSVSGTKLWAPVIDPLMRSIASANSNPTVPRLVPSDFR